MAFRDDIPENCVQKIDEIKHDHVHGSTFLAKKTVDILISFTQSYHFLNVKDDEILNDYAILLASCIHAQPQMGLLFDIANQFLFFFDSLDQRNNKNSIISYLNTVKETITSTTSSFSAYLGSIMKENPCVFTYSSSSSIIASFIQLHKEGIKFEVVCSESRPKNEGINTAKTLADHLIPVTLCTEASLFSSVKQADMVIIGADAICNKGIVNKVGSFPLINLAQQHDIPRYVLCDSRKFLPYGYILPAENMKPAEDIYDERSPEHLSILNMYFDYTPLALFSYVISENGFLSIQRVREQMMNKKVHKRLMNMLSTLSL